MKALVFDMDGVIVDSELQWMLCSREFFRRILPAWKESDNHKIVGLAVEDLYHWLVDEYSLTHDKKEFLKECHEIADRVYKEKTSLMPGIKEFLDDARRRGILLGLASSSPRAWISMTLERFALSSCFERTASADDVPSGRTKPHPDLYLRVLSGLGVRPEDAVAVEDSSRGVAAAKAAGMACAGFRNGHNDEQDLSLADLELRGFEGSSAQALAARLSATRSSRNI